MDLCFVNLVSFVDFLNSFIFLHNIVCYSTQFQLVATCWMTKKIMSLVVSNEIPSNLTRCLPVFVLREAE